VWISWTLLSSHQPEKCREVSSGPLSQRMDSGMPTCLATRSHVPEREVRADSTLDKLVSTSNVRHSRVKASTMARMRMPRPVARASQAKSTAHSWLERNHGRPSLARRTNRFLLSRRTISRSSRSLFMTKVLLRRYRRVVRSPNSSWWDFSRAAPTRGGPGMRHATVLAYKKALTISSVCAYSLLQLSTVDT
jgi:hypothetical protein